MELFRTLGVLLEPPSPDHQPLADLLDLGPVAPEAEHTELFLFQLYPYASVYLGAEGMLGGEARDRIAGFWRALSETPPAEPDHLAVMLALYAQLAEPAAGGEPQRRAQRAFLCEHLLSWLPVYLAKLDCLAPTYYRRWSRVLRQALAAEAGRLGHQERLSLHLRQAPALVDPRIGGSEGFLDSLLSPARSGLILVRDDLVRAARECELAPRAGERRFVLKALLSQEPAATLGWIARECDGWATRHREQAELLGPAAHHWAGRARATAALARELIEDGSP
ncbi:MAG: hypothetical protein GY719_11530 [bacterium]|nr:hypothetical protein [bacterium]